MATEKTPTTEKATVPPATPAPPTQSFQADRRFEVLRLQKNIPRAQLVTELLTEALDARQAWKPE